MNIGWRHIGMTKKEIIEMAKQAGFERLGVYAQFGDDWVSFTEDLETFAKLIAEHEREACAKIVEEPWQGSPKAIAEQIRARGVKHG
jgi:hypothetical protein